MKRVVQVVALTGLMTLAAGWVAAAPAGAATRPQVVHIKVNVSLTNIDQCGFTVDSVVQGTNTMQVFVDASGNVTVQDESHVVSTLTNTANGKVVHVANAGRDAFTPDGVVNPDGTTTFTDTLTGMPMRVYTSHSSTLVKDVGFLSMVDTFDAQGNFLSEQVIEHGPHPFGGDFTVFCNAIASAIG
jgi:streptogramin lyase